MTYFDVNCHRSQRNRDLARAGMRNDSRPPCFRSRRNPADYGALHLLPLASSANSFGPPPAVVVELAPFSDCSSSVCDLNISVTTASSVDHVAISLHGTDSGPVIDLYVADEGVLPNARSRLHAMLRTRRIAAGALALDSDSGLCADIEQAAAIAETDGPKWPGVAPKRPGERASQLN